ncbi:MAG: phosphate/phosphite/phosphonate ABC transporter substrate-binding protein [Ferrovibrionaceae bacterium]
MSASLIACARMYAVTPAARDAWRTLLAEAGRRAGLDLTIIDHAYPAPLGELWGRPDLAAAFMCGWPLAQRDFSHPVVAAPAPSDRASAGRAVYRTHFVVAADAPFRTLEDTFGHRMAFTVEDSHSGYNAPRHHLLPYRRARGGAPLFAAMVGPVITPRRVLETVAAGEADVGPLDSYAYALMMRHDRELAGRFRVVASTDPIPMPPLVAAPGTDPQILDRLAGAFLSFDGREEAMQALLLSGFERPDARIYAVTQDWARAAGDAGLERLG